MALVVVLQYTVRKEAGLEVGVHNFRIKLEALHDQLAVRNPATDTRLVIRVASAVEAVPLTAGLLAHIFGPGNGPVPGLPVPIGSKDVTIRLNRPHFRVGLHPFTILKLSLLDDPAVGAPLV